ncbi:hypothetical protein [Cellulomonas hominis]
MDATTAAHTPADSEQFGIDGGEQFGISTPNSSGSHTPNSPAQNKAVVVRQLTQALLGLTPENPDALRAPGRNHRLVIANTKSPR